MDKEAIKEISNHLMCPSGEKGLEVALKMNHSNQELMKESIKVLSPCIGDKIIEVGMGNGILSIPINRVFRNERAVLWPRFIRYDDRRSKLTLKKI